MRPRTPRELIEHAADRFETAGLHFGHGTDNALDEAAFLVLHALGLPPDAAGDRLEQPLAKSEFEAADRLVGARIARRVPAAYLTNRMWFAGHEFYVDERVLVPRSPIAEMIGGLFQPWLGATRVQRALDIGTGSGCIAIALALAFPDAHVHATELSRGALAVAALNRARYGLDGRLTLHEADVFPDAEEAFDLIVSNPPYVPASAHAALPAEYAHEPREALVAGARGLDCVERIIYGASQRLRNGGLLVVEVGERQAALEQRFARTPFTWVEFEHGGEGVFVLHRDELPAGRD